MRNEAELIRSMKLILAAAAFANPQDAEQRLPVFHQAFASVVTCFRGENAIADRFIVSGKGEFAHCPELASGLSLAIMNGFATLDTRVVPPAIIVGLRDDEIELHSHDPIFTDALFFVREYQKRIPAQ